MDRFIKKTLTLSVLLLCIFGINWAVNMLFIRYSELPIRKRRVLIAGDSHPAKSLDPSLFSSANNISQSGEPYILTYWKLRYIFKRFRPDTMILGFSYHNLSSFNDFKFVDDFWSGEMFRRSYFIGDFDRVDDIGVNYSNYFKTYFRRMCLFPHTNHFTFIGRYSSNDESHISDIKYTIQRHYYRQGRPLSVSRYSIACLDSIIALCRKYKVVPVLVGTPVREEYLTNVPDHIADCYKRETERFTKAGIEVLDMTDEYYADSCYLDQDHLNGKGAALFTARVRSMIAPNSLQPVVVKTGGL